MRVNRFSSLLAALVLSMAAGTRAQAGIVVGQVDDFEDGTTQNWTVGILGATHPAPPKNIASGGPRGDNDNYLKLTAVGGLGAGNRLVAINLAQWTGDYSAAGVGVISMDLLNLGSTDVTIRLFLENPQFAPPTDAAVTNGVFLAAGSGWTRASFWVTPSALTSLSGDIDTLLSNVTALRIIQNPDPNFPGPEIVASLGVDNISAAAPEPGTLTTLCLGLVGFAGWRLRRRQRGDSSC